jgi:hypothetical protein
MYTETCQKYPVTVIFYYIFHIKPQFFKTLFQSQFLFDFDEMLSAADHGFEPRSGQTKDYEIGICCFSAKHAALRRKSKDWLARNQDICVRVG